MQPLVSVVVLTYNHEKYIAKAINSVLAQKCNFEIEIIIADDCSIDRTSEIVLSYKNIKNIKIIIGEKNVGAKENEIRSYKLCLGKYIALCEGDDYWTDPYKLQKQVDFLEQNPDYSICSHRFKTYNNQQNEYFQDKYPEYLMKDDDSGIDVDLKMYFDHYLMKTLTVVFRRDALNINYLEKYKYFRDVHLFFHLILQGKGRLMNFTAGVYTLHKGGIWSSINEYNKKETSFKLYYELFLHNNYIIHLRNRSIQTLNSFINVQIENSSDSFLKIMSNILLLFTLSKSFKIFFSKLYFFVLTKKRF